MRNNPAAPASFTALTYVSLFGLALTVPLLLLLGALLVQSAFTQRAQMEDRLLKTLDGIVADLDRVLDQHMTILNTLATSPSLASGDWRAFHERATTGLQGRAYLVVVDAGGRQLVNTYMPFGKQPALTGDPESLHRILDTKAPVVSNLFMSLAVKKPVFSVSIPILRDNEVRYVMSLGLLPEHLFALLRSRELGSEWVTLLWDRKGVILAHSPDNSLHVGKAVPEAMRQFTPRTVVRTAGLNGVDNLYVAERSPISGWHVGVSIPYAMVTGQMRRSLLIWGVASALAIAIALTLGLFFARQLTVPLSVAAKAAAAFGHGQSIPLTGSRLVETDALIATLRTAQQERERLTEALQKSRDWLHTTLASIGDAIIATDAKGRITFLNGVAENLTGWSAKEAEGRSLEEVFLISNQETGAPAENPVNRVLREGRMTGLANHTVLTARNGRRVPIDDSAAPIQDATGELVGVVLVFRDVTDRKDAEDALNRSMAELRRSNEDLRHFALAASHDLQEPLRMITSFSQLLLSRHRSQLAGEAQNSLEFVIQAAQRMQALLASLLAYTQLAYEKQESVPVDLNNVFNSAVANCAAAVQESGATITSDRLPVVLGHQPHFVQLLQNLIANALKYRSTRPPAIHVSAARENDCWHVTVKDNGIGIAPQYHERIFGVFNRLHGKDVSGTGIGLSICQRVVERHGGRIWVESQENKGTTFHFTLPAAADGAGA